MSSSRLSENINVVTALLTAFFVCLSIALLSALISLKKRKRTGTGMLCGSSHNDTDINIDRIKVLTDT